MEQHRALCGQEEQRPLVRRANPLVGSITNAPNPEVGALQLDAIGTSGGRRPWAGEPNAEGAELHLLSCSLRGVLPKSNLCGWRKLSEGLTCTAMQTEYSLVCTSTCFGYLLLASSEASAVAVTRVVSADVIWT